jgi:hypothetical protein
MTTDNETAEHADQAETATAGKPPVELHPPGKSKPNRPLPTNRIAFPKQLDVLRGLDAAAGPMRNAVTLVEVSKIVKMNRDTISLASGFFVDAGLVERIEGSKFRPTDVVHEYAMAYGWAPETAAHKLAPAFRQSWFWPILESRLRFRAIGEREALQVFAEETGASPDYEPQLRLILTFLEVAGLVNIDGGMVRLQAASTPEPEPSAKPESPPPTPPATKPGSGGVSTTFTQQPEGLVQFAVSVRVDMTELRTWKPDRIAAFFAGIAQVLAAKGDVELEASDNP